MCIYCTTTNYRKIYENHNGIIPKESNGRTYEIHHIDGNHSNNSPSNLTAVTIQEHYDIHYAQGDWYACMKIGGKMKKSPEEISELARLNAKKHLDNGTHNFLEPGFQSKIQRRLVENGTHIFLGGDIQRRNNKKLVENGTHHFLGSPYSKKMLDDGTHPFLNSKIQSDNCKKAIAKGTHKFPGPSMNAEMMASGKHPSQFQWNCEHCGKSGKGKGIFTRFHGDQCKKAPPK